VPLSFDSRRVGDVTVLTCSGRMLAGDETAAFQSHLDDVIRWHPRLVLHLAGVHSIDSGGLGLIVRYMTRARNAGGALTLCAVSPKIDEVLTMTRLRSVLPPYETESDAIAAAYQGGTRFDASSVRWNVLCVDPSPDVLAYLRELLKKAGYHPMTAGNLPDALVLLTAAQPTVVVIGADLQATRGTRAADEFHRVASTRRVVELPPGFGERDAGDAAQHLLDAIRACIAEAGGAAL
jgi:anti-anti-sigma factor